MRALILLVFSSFLLTQCVFAEEHVNKEQGFALTPAPGWIVKSKDLAFGTYLSVRAPGEDPYGPSLLVYVWPGEHTISGYFEQQKMMLEGTVDDLSFSQASLAGKKAGSYVYTVNNSIKTQATYFSFDGKTYVVNRTARIKTFMGEDEAFNAMFDSFRLPE